MAEDRVVVAEIFKPRGIRGEVSARSQTDVPGRLEELGEAYVRLADGTDLAVKLEAAWPHKGDWVFKFAGIDSIPEAERLAGADLWVPRAERGSLPEGTHFQSDLIGCRVVDRVSGQCLGLISGWQRFGGPPLLEMEYGHRTVLIPFVDAICQLVDVETRTITVELPEGLLDL